MPNSFEVKGVEVEDDRVTKATVILSDEMIEAMLYKRMINLPNDEGSDGDCWQVEEMPADGAIHHCLCHDEAPVYRMVLIQPQGRPDSSAWYDIGPACLAQSLLESDIVAPMKVSAFNE